MTEQWRPVPGFEASYLVSDHGTVYSLTREVDCGDLGSRRRSGRILKPFRVGTGRGHLAVKLYRGRRQGRIYRVHQLVARAFIGPVPEGLEVLHWDDDSTNNHLSNLRYGTRSENVLDRVRNRTHHNTTKTRCPSGHEYTPENTYVPPGGRERQCRQCRAEQSSARDRLNFDRPPLKRRSAWPK